MNNISQSIISRASYATNQSIRALPNKVVLLALAVIALIAAIFMAVRHYRPHPLSDHSTVPLQPQNTIPENALSPDNVLAEAIKYGAKDSTIAWTNQSKEGFRAGCTRNSLGFLASDEKIDYTPESLTDFMQRGDERGILPPDEQGNYEMDDPSELLSSNNSFNLTLVDQFGLTTCFPVQINLDEEGAEHKVLAKTINNWIYLRSFIKGFAISAGTETFAVRFRPNGDVEFFDPHGDSTQQEPSFIFTFDQDKAAENISQLILDRCLTTIQLGIAGRAVNLSPCALSKPDS